MDRRQYLTAAGVAATAGVAGCLSGDPEPIDGVRVETVADGLTNPWGLAFLPDGTLLITERDTGRVKRVDTATGETTTITGAAGVDTGGQGGMLDIAIHPEFPAEPWVYLTYAVANDERETTTALGRGRVDDHLEVFTEFEQLRAVEPFLDRRNHYGSRVIFGPDGMVYLTVGDRQFKDFGPDHVSQDTTNEIGTTLRLQPDGTIPEDNPFVEDADVVDSIYSYGHRNAQGMTVHPETGEIWQSEHGEQDGDELNIIEAGGNYGWPVTHFGCTYVTGQPVGDRPDEREDIVDPVYYWECNSGGFPPAGMTFHTGEEIPQWEGDLFVGNLAGEYLGHFTVDGTDVTEAEPLLADRGWRIRDVTESPEGVLYVAVDADPAPVVRLVRE